MDGHRVPRPDGGHGACRSEGVEVLAGLGRGTPAPHGQQRQVDAACQVRHALEVGRVTSEVVMLGAVDEEADGEVRAADGRTEAVVLGVDGLDAQALPTWTSSPGATSVTRRKPRRRSPLPMPARDDDGHIRPEQAQGTVVEVVPVRVGDEDDVHVRPVPGLERPRAGARAVRPASAGWDR